MPGLTTGYTGSQLFGTTFAGDILIDDLPGLPLDGEWFAFRMPVGDEYNSLRVSVNPIVFATDPVIWITDTNGKFLSSGVRSTSIAAKPGELYFICALHLQFGKSVLNFIPGYIDRAPVVTMKDGYLHCPLLGSSIWIRRYHHSRSDRWLKYSGGLLLASSYPLTAFATAPGFLASAEWCFSHPNTSSSSGLDSPMRA